MSGRTSCGKTRFCGVYKPRMETEERRRSQQARRHRALQRSCKWEQEELKATTQQEQQGVSRNKVLLIFFRLFGCCIVWNYCSSSVSLQCSYSADCFGNEAATTALRLLIIVPVVGSQNKLPSAPKYVKGCYYTSQGRAPCFGFCFETTSWYLPVFRKL